MQAAYQQSIIDLALDSSSEQGEGYVNVKLQQKLNWWTTLKCTITKNYEWFIAEVVQHIKILLS